jgi:hypothetical protein
MWGLFQFFKILGPYSGVISVDNQFYLVSSEQLKRKSVCQLPCLYCLLKTPVYIIKIKLLNTNIVCRFI